MYKVDLSRESKATYEWLKKRDAMLLERIDRALDVIKQDPFAGKPLKMNLHGSYSYRVGVYRIFYRVFRDKLLVYVLDIGHRREVYRRK